MQSRYYFNPHFIELSSQVQRLRNCTRPDSKSKEYNPNFALELAFLTTMP